MRPVCGPGDDAARIVGTTPCGCPSRHIPIPPTRERSAGTGRDLSLAVGDGTRAWIGRERPFARRAPRFRIPAFAGMTGFRGGARRRGNPRRRLDVVPYRIKGTPGLAFRRHSRRQFRQGGGIAESGVLVLTRDDHRGLSLRAIIRSASSVARLMRTARDAYMETLSRFTYETMKPAFIAVGGAFMRPVYGLATMARVSPKTPCSGRGRRRWRTGRGRRSPGSRARGCGGV